MTVKRRSAASVSTALLILIAAQASAATTTVRVSPATANVRLLGTETFSVSGVPSGTTLIWQLVSTTPSAKPAGTSTTSPLGTIDSSGHYTAPTAMPSPNTVNVQVLDSKSAVLATATITLLNPIPSITSLTPNEMNVGLKTTVAIVGTGFVPGSILQFDGTAVPAAKYVVKNATEIDYTDTPAATGTPKVTVLNPSPDAKVSNAYTLTIDPAVTVTLTASTSTLRGGTAVTLHPAVHDNPDAKVTFSVTPAVGTVLTDSKTNVITYTAPMDLPQTPKVSIVATSVADPKASSAPLVLNLENPTPVITKVAPSPLVINSVPSITVTGTGFAQQATLTV